MRVKEVSWNNKEAGKYDTGLRGGFSTRWGWCDVGGGGGDRERKGEHGVLIPKFPLWDNPQIL